MSKLVWAFWLAVLAGIAGVVIFAAIAKSTSSHNDARELAGNVWVTDQLVPDDLNAFKSKGFHAIIDLRPDAEEANQASSALMQQAAQAYDLAFTYIPVPHGEIPSDAVDKLMRTLVGSEKPVLLYCRSGKRAARTWALAEASRAEGLDALAIKRAVHSVGQSADDLNDAIATRISARSQSK